MDCCRKFGMNMPNRDEIYFHTETTSSRGRVEKSFQNILTIVPNCQLFIVFLPQKGGSLYGKVLCPIIDII